MSTRVFIAVYRPHAGKEEHLEALVTSHYPVLRRLGLVTERQSWLLRAANGVLVEIGEWQSELASEQAHQHPEIEALWSAMEEVADFEPLGKLLEADRLFPHFVPV